MPSTENEQQLTIVPASPGFNLVLPCYDDHTGQV
jgi:hypothetical protein